MKKYIRKQKREPFLSKVVNLTLTILIACAISSQVCKAANNNLRIAQISDAHFSSFEKNTPYKFLEKSGSLLDDAIFQINTTGSYDFVIFTGDLINKPLKSELSIFLEHANKLIYPWYAIDGNHDIDIDGKLTKKDFMDILGKSNKNLKNQNIYYSFSPKKGFRVLCLDSIIDYKLTSNGEIPKKELEWIKNELKKYEKDIIIVCTHVPVIEPYSSSSHEMLNAYELKKILNNHKNPLIVLQGHYHGTRIKQDNNMLIISCPSLVTFPNAFRVININTNKKRTLVDVYLKETNLKTIQKRSKLRLLGIDNLYGRECDRNATFNLGKVVQ